MFATIFGFIGKATGSYLAYAVIAAFVGLLAVTGVFWVQKNSAEKAVATLALEKDRMSGTIDALNVTIANGKLAVQVLEQTNATLTDNAAAESAIQQEISNAAPSEDAPIAPVLDRAIRSLGRVRHTAPGAAH